MSQIVVLALDEPIYTVIQQRAAVAGTSLSAWIIQNLTQEVTRLPELTPADREVARRRFAQHFGEIDLGHPTGVDNDAIDADLLHAYGDAHEES